MTAQLAFRLAPALDKQHRARYVLTRRADAYPSVIGGLYEAALSNRYDSPKTLYKRLGGLVYLLTWAEETACEVERRFLAGTPLETRHISGIAMWIESRFTRDGVMPRAKRLTFNSILDAVRAAEAWFLSNAYRASDPARSGIEIDRLLAGQTRIWNRWKRRNAGINEAPDLSDEVVAKIEAYVRNSARAPNASHNALRTYLIWRLTMEYGLRIGEVLALRIQDCPRHPGSLLHIVRIEDRDSRDPRGIYAPRPKTLGRSLGTIHSNTMLPHLIWDYVSAHRFSLKKRPDGTTRRSPRVPHPFLLVSEGGAPLSQASASKAAQRIATEVGIPFHGCAPETDHF